MTIKIILISTSINLKIMSISTSIIPPTLEAGSLQSTDRGQELKNRQSMITSIRVTYLSDKVNDLSQVERV